MKWTAERQNLAKSVFMDTLPYLSPYFFSQTSKSIIKYNRFWDEPSEDVRSDLSIKTLKQKRSLRTQYVIIGVVVNHRENLSNVTQADLLYMFAGFLSTLCMHHLLEDSWLLSLVPTYQVLLLRVGGLGWQATKPVNIWLVQKETQQSTIWQIGPLL